MSSSLPKYQLLLILDWYPCCFLGCALRALCSSKSLKFFSWWFLPLNILRMQTDLFQILPLQKWINFGRIYLGWRPHKLTLWGNEMELTHDKKVRHLHVQAHQGLGLMSQLLGICFTSLSHIYWRLYPQLLGDVNHWDIYHPLYIEDGLLWPSAWPFP